MYKKNACKKVLLSHFEEVSCVHGCHMHGANKEERIRKLELASTPPVATKGLGQFKLHCNLALKLIQARLRFRNRKNKEFGLTSNLHRK